MDTKRYKIISTTILGLILLGFVGTCIYFVAGVSDVFPPIKIYDYPGDMNQLTKQMKSVSALNKNISFTINDTTGDKKIGHNYEITIKFRNIDRDIEYQVTYAESDFRFTSHKSVIEIIGAFDITHNKGGYGMNGEVKDLVNLFEIYILPKLKG